MSKRVAVLIECISNNKKQKAANSYARGYEVLGFTLEFLYLEHCSKSSPKLFLGLKLGLAVLYAF